MKEQTRRQPIWRPITALPLISSVIEQGLADTKHQYSLLLEAKHRPSVLDDHTVNRVFQVYGDTHDDLWVFEEQLQRWSKGSLTTRQRSEVDRLILAQRQMREVVEDILALAEVLQANTIEATLAKSDFDLGLEAVFGGQVITGRPVGPPSKRAREAVRNQRSNLPEGVSLTKGMGPSGAHFYVITHIDLGPVGRIIITPTRDDQTRLDAEVVGDPTDKGFDRRSELVGLVYKDVERLISYGL